MTSKNTFSEGDLVIVKSSDRSKYKEFLRESPLSVGVVWGSLVLPKCDSRVFWVLPPNRHVLAYGRLFNGDDLIKIKKG